MFTFLNTIILSALGLALIPVVIHLLNRKKSKLILFSTLDFLKALQIKKMKRVRIQQILLLVLRTLILLLAVMAFARPVSKIENRGAIDAHAKTSVIIILDNGVSSSYISEKGMVLDGIKTKAEEILHYLKEGDEAIILTGAHSAENPSAAFTQNFTSLIALVKNITFSYAKPDILEALYTANKCFETAKNINREIYVLTSLQSSGFGEEKINIQPGIKLIFVDCSAKEFRNIGIRNLQVISRIIEKNKPVEIRTVIKNYGKDRVQDILLSAYLEGRRVGQSSLTIGAEDESVIDMKIIPTRSGYQQGYIEIDDDALAADNKQYYHFYVPDQINVLIAGNKGGEEFLKLALNPLNDPAGPIRTKTITPEQIPIENLSEYDILIYSNMPRLDESAIRRLETYLNSGKGLIIIPGSDTDIGNLNSWLPKAGFGKILSLTDNSLQPDIFTKFGKVDYSHPIIKGMFDQNGSESQSLESPGFIKFFKTDRSTQSQTLISYMNNDPFLEESGNKNLNALMFTSAVNLSWSDWPIKGIFAPLINRAVYYVYSKTNGNEKSFIAGEPLELRIHSASAENLILIDPNGAELKPKIRQLGADAVISVPMADIPGTYRVLEGNKLLTVFDVNIEPSRIEPRKIGETKLKELVNAESFRVISATENIESVILQSRYGFELWSWFLFGALVLLAVEFIISQNHRFSKTAGNIL